jgi:hypothetical protein
MCRLLPFIQSDMRGYSSEAVGVPALAVFPMGSDLRVEAEYLLHL